MVESDSGVEVNTMTERESAETKRAWREMCRNYAQMTMALTQMAKGAAVFRAGAALGDVQLDPQIPDLLNSASYDSALNNFVRQCVAAGIIKTNDEGLRHVNYKR